MAGAKEARPAAGPSAAVIGFWGDGPAPGRSPFRGGGEPKSVIDGKRRRLSCLRPAVFRVTGSRQADALNHGERWETRRNGLLRSGEKAREGWLPDAGWWFHPPAASAMAWLAIRMGHCVSW